MVKTSKEAMRRKMLKSFIAIALAAVVTVGSGYGTQAMAAAPDAGGVEKTVTERSSATGGAGLSEVTAAAKKASANVVGGGVHEGQQPDSAEGCVQ